MECALPLHEKIEITRPIFRYQGSKFRIVQWIISFFPRYEVYCEPFGGGAGVLFQKPKSTQEIYNDLNSEVVHVFRVLRDKEKAEELQRLIELTPWSREEYCESRQSNENDDDIEKARKIIVRSYMGISAGSINRKSSGFLTQINNKEYKCPSCKAWTNYPQQIMEYCRRLQGVIIENRDGMEVIKIYDTDKTLHYVDPPYVMSTWRKGDKKTYVQTYTDKEHAQLIELLKQVKGYVILSGYKCDLYMDLLKDWHMEKRETLNQRNQPRTEYIWISPKTWDRRTHQKTLWGG